MECDESPELNWAKILIFCKKIFLNSLKYLKPEILAISKNPLNWEANQRKQMKCHQLAQLSEYWFWRIFEYRFEYEWQVNCDRCCHIEFLWKFEYPPKSIWISCLRICRDIDGRNFQKWRPIGEYIHMDSFQAGKTDNRSRYYAIMIKETLEQHDERKQITTK